jgi:glycosyltransferase involved in cell wall biosynthesis
MIKRPIEPGRVAVVVSAYNEAEVLGALLDELVAAGYRGVVVDDGSNDATAAIAARYPVDLLRHPVNLGAGAAVQTGVEHAATLDVDAVVTIDGDGQHPVEEIAALAAPVLAGEVDVVFGSRFLDRKADRMPRGRRWMLKLAIGFTRATSGLNLTDTHNGMRAFSMPAARRLALVQNGFAYCSEVVHWVARSGLRWSEAPVRVRYTDYSLRKGQSVWSLFNILWDLLMG